MKGEEKVNILLVDDVPENLLALVVALERLGENLVTAGSGREALKRLLEDDFAAILLDVQMPEMDGFETAAVIRERDALRNTPIIFITAINKSENHVFKGYSLGAVDYIFKPLDGEVLRSKVTVFADLYRKSRQVSRLNETLKRRTVELEATNEELRAFTTSVSHDLRAPLRAIDGFARILERRHRDELSPDGQHYVDNILKASTQMEHLISNLLAYSRVGRFALRYQPVDLGPLVAHIKESMAGRIAESVGTVEVVGNLPTVVAYRSLLEEILTNLIDNALTFHRPGIPPTVEISCDTEPDGVTIRVRDNGIGIAAEHREKVFQVFQRLRTDEEYPGTGIGLAVVRKSVGLMGGRVWVEPAPKEGSVFCVQLPRGGVSASQLELERWQ